ncbi:metal-dependent phosphohydrolase [Nocardia puris]|uniref:HD domain-containing protein n=1 Tax=Nocardia puris TaxID=208602 RepID=UPI0018952C69|nr:HD domain-containing protein [Nocardia puris]MBF6212557.1 metal-dependent phosphohydrolase [Nocardia puris]MBF6369137.1 metal-dependent phosphohydrolase [Nocardia puris]MBF6463338.1 metal-dependent phosphohydrolase [Nocardia puris]
MGIEEDLLARWAALAGPGTEHVGEDLVRRYREPHRHYHTVEHLAAMLRVIDELAADADDPDAVRYAAFFHDAIYAVDRDDNEARSAELAETTLRELGLPEDLVREVVRLVLVTAAHAPEAGDRNGGVLCDADLAILAAGESAYAAYASAVRAEYAHVPDDLYRKGRSAVLANLAALPQLFHTDTGRERYESVARANLAAELARLSGRAG